MTQAQVETNLTEQGLALIEETLLNNVSGGAEPNTPACKSDPCNVI